MDAQQGSSEESSNNSGRDFKGVPPPPPLTLEHKLKHLPVLQQLACRQMPFDRTLPELGSKTVISHAILPFR